MNGAAGVAVGREMRGHLKFAALLAAVLPAAAVTAQTPRRETTAPPPPVLLSPPDDPDQDHCFKPDPAGIKLTWKRSDQSAPDFATYIEVRRGDAETGTWHPWVKKYANPPFTLNVHPSVYDAVFAWRVWTVDRSGKSKPYATPSEWWLFCTKPPNDQPQR